MRSSSGSSVLTLAAVLALAASPARAASPSDPILDSLAAELSRSSVALKARTDAPLYYLSYRMADVDTFTDSASFGALESHVEDSDPLSGRQRILDVSARVGSRAFDSTHQVRGGMDYERYSPTGTFQLPIEPDSGALRIAIWRSTDQAYKTAVRRFINANANRAVKVDEAEDHADDFSQEKPHVSIVTTPKVAIDEPTWRERLKRVSALFKDHPKILNSSVSLQGMNGTFYFADSEGARIREPRFFARVFLAASTKAADGSDLDLYDSVEVTRIDELPSEEDLVTRTRTLIAKLEALQNAPVVDPYSGPAIISARAAAVFFHEIFGHRIEGHRQKDADEGRTFAKKVGQRIVPEFISVSDDPTRSTFGKTPLNGHYGFDDEGIPAQKVTLVKNGVLQAFLMGRSPIDGFPHSNGHGRAQPGLPPVARQGNLLVDSGKQLSSDELRAQLIAEAKRRGKPYGLMFDEISGGFTNTRTGGDPQAFKVLPLIVHRVYADGRPDELVRGVDLVGTPLTSFEQILATGSDFAVFNGYCGAESGWVPVSAVAPSLLVGTIEIERKAKSHDRPPLLRPPDLKPPAAASLSPSASSSKEQP